MAEEERQTKKERRERSREDRKRKEAEKRKAERRQRLITSLTSVLVLAAIGAVIFAAVGPGDGGDLEDAVLVSQDAAEEGRESAGCETLAEEPLPEASHFEPAQAPPADQLYTDTRPTHSGPHYTRPHPVVSAGSESQLDERATTHNLEHGAVIVWYDPEQVDDVGAIETWAEQFNDAGFAESQSGGAIFVSPYTDPGISSGKAIAVRAWGRAVDCDSFDEDFVNGFVIDNYGTNGTAPEAGLSPYPEDVLAYGDPESGSTEPGDDETTGDETDTDDE